MLSRIRSSNFDLISDLDPFGWHKLALQAPQDDHALAPALADAAAGTLPPCVIASQHMWSQQKGRTRASSADTLGIGRPSRLWKW